MESQYSGRKNSNDNIITNSDNTKSNSVLHKNQEKIIKQITKTQNIIKAHLISVFLMGFWITLFLIPFLFINREPRIIGAGVIIVMSFNYNFIFQYIRKKQLIFEAQAYLKSIKVNRKISKENQFYQNISQYLSKLYNLIYYDKKTNKIPNAFIEQDDEEQFLITKVQMMNSLRNDLLVNGFSGAIDIIAAILAIILMYDRVILVFNSVFMVILVVTYTISLYLSISLQKKLSLWIKGFNELQLWENYINNMENSRVISQDQEKNQIFCPLCGEPRQYIGKYCQNCGELL